MFERPGASCEVLDCRQPAAGSYLHAADAGSVEFGVCEVHLTRLRAGARPAVVDDVSAQDGVDGRPVLLVGET
jgi:hypothetical protein